MSGKHSRAVVPPHKRPLLDHLNLGRASRGLLPLGLRRTLPDKVRSRLNPAAI